MQIWTRLIPYFHITTHLWLVGVIMLPQLCCVSLLFCHEETAEQILSQNFTVLAGTQAFPGLVHTAPLHTEPVNVQSCIASLKQKQEQGLAEIDLPSLACSANTFTHSDWNQAVWAPTNLLRIDTISESGGQLFSGKQQSLQASETLTGFCAPLSLLAPQQTYFLSATSLHSSQLCRGTPAAKEAMWTAAYKHRTAKALHVRTACTQELNTAWEESTAHTSCAINLPKVLPFYLRLCPSSSRVSRNTASWEMGYMT